MEIYSLYSFSVFLFVCLFVCSMLCLWDSLFVVVVDIDSIYSFSLLCREEGVWGGEGWFCPQVTFGDTWRPFRLSQPGGWGQQGVLLAVSGRDQERPQNPTVPRKAPPPRAHSAPNGISAKAEKPCYIIAVGGRLGLLWIWLQWLLSCMSLHKHVHISVE